MFFSRALFGAILKCHRGPKKQLDYKLDYNAFFGIQKILEELTNPLYLQGKGGAPIRS